MTEDPVFEMPFDAHEPPVCDYCDEGTKRIFGWHEISDPEGVEGTQRIKCPRFEYDQAHEESP